MNLRHIHKKSLKIQRDNQNLYIEEEQTTKWPKEKGQKNKQRSTKHTHKTKDRVSRTPLKIGGELKFFERKLQHIIRNLNQLIYPWSKVDQVAYNITDVPPILASSVLTYIQSLKYFTVVNRFTGQFVKTLGNFWQ